MNRGEAPEAWSPKRVGGPTRGVGAWTVAMETVTTARPFAPVETGRVRGKRKAPEKEGTGT